MDTAIATILAGTGVAGVWVISFLTGLCYPKSVVTDKDAQIAELKAENAALRDQNATQAGTQVTMRDILVALAFGQQHAGSPPGSAGGT